MNGYEHHHMIRMAPENGDAKTLDLRREFRDGRGPTQTRLFWRYESEKREDVNRKRSNVSFGFRFFVRLNFDIALIADHRALAEIVTALGNDTTTVDLSLDGGSTYREVVLSSPPSPVPLGGKTIAGARFVLQLEGSEVLDEFPTLDGGW